MHLLLQLADKFFYIFHIGLILFNLFGWVYKPLRKWNLLTVGLTAFSWIILGIFYGFGYCFLTDWHWQIREALGYETPYDSYILFLIKSFFPISISAKMVDMITGILFFTVLIISITLNIRDYRKRK